MCFATVKNSYAQLPIKLPEDNIKFGTSYITIPPLDYGPAPALALLAVLDVKSSLSSIPVSGILGNAGKEIALSQIVMKVNSITNNVTLGTTTQVSPAIITYKTLLTVVASLGLQAGNVNMDFTLSKGTTGWISGTYSTTLNFRAGGLLGIWNYIDKNLTIEVPSFITPLLATAPIVDLQVNDFSFFASGGITSLVNTFDYYTTVASTISVNANNTSPNPEKFTFTATVPHSLTPIVDASVVNVKLDPVQQSVNLTATPALLTNTNIAVANSNKNTISTKFNITSDNLKSSFIQAGTYTLPISYKINLGTSAYAEKATSATLPGTVKVTVAPMLNLSITGNTVPLTFNTAEKYKSGTTTNMPKHITTSSTVAYDVSVRSQNANFSSAVSGNTTTLPLNLVNIGGTGLTTITLSAADQKIVSGAAPQIGREIDINYIIPNLNTPSLIGKPAGDYSATVIYSITAQ